MGRSPSNPYLTEVFQEFVIANSLLMTKKQLMPNMSIFLNFLPYTSLVVKASQPPLQEVRSCFPRFHSQSLDTFCWFSIAINCLKLTAKVLLCWVDPEFSLSVNNATFTAPANPPSYNDRHLDSTVGSQRGSNKEHSLLSSECRPKVTPFLAMLSGLNLRQNCSGFWLYELRLTQFWLK